MHGRILPADFSRDKERVSIEQNKRLKFFTIPCTLRANKRLFVSDKGHV
jgi:hypothetical protein